MSNIILDYTVSILQQPHDSMDHVSSNHRRLLRNTVLEGKYHEVLTLVEFLLRSSMTHKFKIALCGVFETVPVAYSVEIMNDIQTIVPRPSPESGAATKQAIKDINKGPEGAKTHLRKATEAINTLRYADAVRESINCVEAVARTIDPRAQTLGHALKLLENAGVLKHKALQGAFEKLYGYTSDEKGIRHSLLEEGNPDVDLEDAIFMFAACAAFSAYLVKKHDQAVGT